MKALIDPTNLVSYATSWYKIGNEYFPTTVDVPDSARVCQIESDEDTFGVAEPLFWQDCTDEIVPDVYYFNTQSLQYVLTPPSAPKPVNQPIVDGAQTI